MNGLPAVRADLDLEALARQIAAEHAQARAAWRTSVVHALRTGELLIEAKRRVGHGGFQSFVQSYCEISTRTAQAYMRIFRELPKLAEAKAQHVADLSLRDVLSAIATDTRNIASLPPPAAELALEEAEKDPLRCAVSRQMTAERTRSIQQSRPDPSSYETVVIEGAPAHPPSFASPAHPAWRLGLQLNIMDAVKSAVRQWPEINADDVCEALNDVYVQIQEDGLHDISDVIELLGQSYVSALKAEGGL